MKRSRVYLAVSVLLSALVISACNTIANEEAQGGKSKVLTVYTLNIGQGDSSVITTPDGKNILIDGGMGGSGYKTKDKGKTVILPFLKEKGIKKLDYMIMTHPDFDHIGGLIYLLENTKKESDYPLDITEFLDPGAPATTYLYKDELLGAVKARPEIKYRVIKNGEFLDFGKGVTAQAMAPHHIFDDANNNSIVLKVIYGDVSFLLTGDAAKESEHYMIEDYGNSLKSTILHAGHHGSDHSSSTAFLQKVQPEVIKISVGTRNKFILPDENALKRLDATGAKIYRTDYNGMITITTDGKSYDVAVERETPPLRKRWDFVPEIADEDRININTAPAEILRTLPRIGEKMAEQIILHRPFESIDELHRVPRIGEKIVERLRPLVTVGDPDEAVTSKEALIGENAQKNDVKKDGETVVVPDDQKIDPNTASAAQLEDLTGIGNTTARRIIDGRPYEKPEDLLKVKGIGEKKLEMLSPYLMFETKEQETHK